MGNNDSLPNINSKGTQQNTFDAIVIGSGMTGGWAAKELCEKGLKILVLERGRNVRAHKRLSNSHTGSMGTSAAQCIAQKVFG